MHQRKRMSWYLRAAHWNPWDEAWNSTITRHCCLKSPIYHYIFKNRRFFTKTEQIFVPSYCDALYWDWGHSRQRGDRRANWTITYCSCCRSSVVLYETVSKGQNGIRGLADKSDLSLRQADDYVADVQWINPLWTQRSTVCWQRYSHHVPKYWPNGGLGRLQTFAKYVWEVIVHYPKIACYRLPLNKGSQPITSKKVSVLRDLLWR